MIRMIAGSEPAEAAVSRRRLWPGLLLVGGRDHDGNTSVRARDEREATPRTLRHVSNYYTTPVRNR